MSIDDDFEEEFPEEDLEEELDMFVEAQDAVWGDVVAELKAGKKTSHWMWFVFAQLRGLGPKIDEETIAASIALLAECWAGDEAPEGIGAFFDKRKPRWAD